MKVLIIDDESFDLFIAKKLLGLEFETEGFTEPDEAIQWALQNPFDVVLIDYYITTTIQAQHVLAKILAAKPKSFRAYVLTNYVDSNQTAELTVAGFDGVIMKPLTLEGFKFKIQDSGLNA